jgi:uncharacterized protein YggE
MKYLIATFTISALLLSSSIFGQGANSFIKVKGQATVKAQPEILTVQIPLRVQELSYEKCNETLKSTFNSLTAALIAAGFDKENIKSDRLRVNEVYNYQSGQRIRTGFEGSITVHLETNYTDESLAQIMSTLQQEEYNFGYNLGFELSEKQKRDLKEESMKDAVADAREKAEILATAAGMKLGSIFEINYEYDHAQSGPFMAERAYMADAKVGGEDISLNPEDMEIRKEVGIIWQLIDPK